MFAKRKNKWLIILALMLLPTSVFGINRIYLSNIDGTAPTTLPVPGDGGGTLLTSSGVLWLSEGSLYGTKWTTNLYPHKSIDGGITWTQLATADCKQGIKFVTTNILLCFDDDASSASRIRRSINDGTSWSVVYSVSAPTISQRMSVDIEGSRIWAAVAGNIVYSDDNGATWTVSLSDSDCNAAANAATGLEANGSTIVVAYRCAGATPGMRVSINNGGSWSAATLASRVVNGVIYINGIWYAIGVSGSATTSFYSSTNGTSWTLVGDTPNSFTGLTYNYSLGSFYDNQTYYVYFVGRNTGDNLVKVWRSSLPTISWSLVYDTANTSFFVGNLLTATDNKIYFGGQSQKVFRLD